MGLLQQKLAPANSANASGTPGDSTNLSPAPTNPINRRPVAEGVALALAMGMAVCVPARLAEAAPVQISPNPNNGHLYLYGAYSNADVPFDNNGTIEIKPPGGSLLNTGDLNNNGYLYNEGRLDNEAGATLDNMGSIYNYGTLDNQTGGTLNNQTGGEISNYGTLSNSGTLNNHELILNAESAHLINEVGGTLNNTGNAYISNFGGTITNNGTLENTNVEGTTYANLYNDGVLNNNGTLNNSGTASGIASLYNAGTINNSSTGALNFNADDSTNGAINEGTINNAGAVEIALGASVKGSGAFRQTGGSAMVDGLLQAALIEFVGGSLSGNGALESSGGPIQIGQGVDLMPGSSPGTLFFLGDTDFAGDLEIEIDGPSPLFDVLDATGSAFNFLTGATIAFDLGFTPMVGDMFEFLLAGSVTGTDLVAVSVAGLDPSLNYEIDWTGSGLSFEIISASGVPTPAPLALMAFGLVGMEWSRLRKTDKTGA